MNSKFFIYTNSELHRHLDDLNKIAVDGLSYVFKDGSIYECVTGDSSREYFEDIAGDLLSEDQLNEYINYRKENDRNEFNFPRLYFRLKMFLLIFNQIREEEGKETKNIDIHLLFNSYLNAEIRAFDRSENPYIFIHSGLYHFQSFCIYFHYWTSIIDNALAGNYSGSKKLLNDYLERLAELIRRHSLQCLGLYQNNKQSFYKSRVFEMKVWDSNENLLRYYSELDRRMINWDTLEVFLVCHELGHFYLGHLDELQTWDKDWSTKDKFIDRRKNMEFEADRFAFKYFLPVLNVSRLHHHKEQVNLNNDFHFNTLFLSPILYFFILISHAENLSEETVSYYPDAKTRFRKLFIDHINEDKMDEIWNLIYKEIFSGISIKMEVFNSTS